MLNSNVAIARKISSMGRQRHRCVNNVRDVIDHRRTVNNVVNCIGMGDWVPRGCAAGGIALVVLRGWENGATKVLMPDLRQYIIMALRDKVCAATRAQMR